MFTAWLRLRAQPVTSIRRELAPYFASFSSFFFFFRWKEGCGVAAQSSVRLEADADVCGNDVGLNLPRFYGDIFRRCLSVRDVKKKKKSDKVGLYIGPLDLCIRSADYRK